MKFITVASFVLTLAFLTQSSSSYSQSSDWVAPKSADALKNPFTGDAASVALGQQLFSSICFVCHGNQGKGDGINAASLTKKPADLTSRSVQRQSDGALFWKISEGNPPMLTFKESLSEEQRWAVVNFVRELPKLYPPKGVVAEKDVESRKSSKESVSTKNTSPKSGAKPAKAKKSEKSTETVASVPAIKSKPFEGMIDGKFLFKNICGACHTVGKGKLVGPDLKGVQNRHGRIWLDKWIRSSQSLVKAGDPEAVRLFEEYNQSVMNDHLYLSDLQITNILDYIEMQGKDIVATSRKTTETYSKTPNYEQPKTTSAFSEILVYFLYAGFLFIIGTVLYVSLVLSKMVSQNL